MLQNFTNCDVKFGKICCRKTIAVPVTGLMLLVKRHEGQIQYRLLLYSWLIFAALTLVLCTWYRSRQSTTTTCSTAGSRSFVSMNGWSVISSLVHWLLCYRVLIAMCQYEWMERDLIVSTLTALLPCIDCYVLSYLLTFVLISHKI